MQTEITRNGAFRDVDASACESKLRVIGRVSGYITSLGIMCIFPDGLTAPQQTQAQAILDAHVAITDNDRLTQQQKNLYQWLQLPSPTNAQNLAALRTMAKMLLRLTYDREKINGTDLET